VDAYKSRGALASSEEVEIRVGQDHQEPGVERTVDDVCETERRESKVVPCLVSVESMTSPNAAIHLGQWEEGQKAGDARDDVIEHQGRNSASGHVGSLEILSLRSGDRRLADR
jgi:hypothetical protein